MLKLRKIFPILAACLLGGALVWAMSFGTLPKADFTFDNGTEIETVDPSLATGQPEHRVINALFEGLLHHGPKPGWQDAPLNAVVEMVPEPGVAEMPEISEDGRVYTFHIRENAKWSNNDAVTAHDFTWSWMRTLHPETAARYAYQLHYLVGAKKYNLAQVEEGDEVEVELPDRPDRLQLVPRGTIIRGVVTSIHKPPEPAIPADASDEQKEELTADWKQTWVYAVEIEGQTRWFAKEPEKINRNALTPALSQRERETSYAGSGVRAPNIEQCLHVLPDFEKTVGVRAENDRTLVVTLENRTPFFNDLVAFYPLYAVHRKCVETHGSPNWTKAENIVSNGAFKMQFRRIRDRVRMVKNEHYWDAANVKLNVVDALAIKSETTSLNMYLNGQVDWATHMPVGNIPKLKKELPREFRTGAELTAYFYRVNVTRPELRDKRVRQALNLATNKIKICERVTRAGELPATTYVPPGIAGYTGPAGPPFDKEKARALLAEAGYPGGRGLPTIEILYNDMDAHRTIAEAIQQMWKENLGINTELRSLEWGVYLDSTHNLDYDVARAGWVADYPDPNTFLDMFQTGNENNQTGWGNAQYDELIQKAAAEGDPERRMEMLRDAESILLDEQPIIPIYVRVTKNLVQPYVKGFFNNVQDEHPLKLLEIVRE